MIYRDLPSLITPSSRSTRFTSDQRQEIELRVQHKDYVMRTEAKGTAGRVFQACGVALPPTLRTGPEPLQPG
jgi:hypothetical protein